MERLRTFRLVGHPLRRGVEDDTTAVPALIPIPEGLGQVRLVTRFLRRSADDAAIQLLCWVVRG